MFIYILIIVLIPIVVPQIKNKLYEIYTNSILRDYKTEKYVENFVKTALKKSNLDDYEIGDKFDDDF